MSAPTLSAEPVSHSQLKRAHSVPSLWVLTNAPSPYQVELLNEVARRDDVELAVRYMRPGSRSGRSVDAEPDYDVRVMWGILPQWCRDEVRLHPRAVWEVMRGRHDIHVLSGLYTSPTFFWCALMSVVLRRKYVLWLERPHSSRGGGAGQGGWIKGSIRSIKRRYLHWLLGHASAVWCIGSQAEREYQNFAGAGVMTRVLPYCCRTDRYQIDRATMEELRSRHDLEGRCVFQFSGQLIARKGVDTLLKAFAKMGPRHPEALLLVLGDGPSREEYASLAKSLGVADQVRFLGHRPQAELPGWFSVADVFLFPSRHDGWAVVINEACAAGLPIIVSSQTGAANDLVRDGVNGFVLDCEDLDSWAERINWCLEHRAELPVMGAASRKLVEQFSSVAGAARVAEFTRELVQASPVIHEMSEAS